MSFAAIRSIATSALTASQVRMQVTSSNIANADVEGYSKKTAVQVATTSSSAGTGTAVTAVTSDVDKYLLSDLVSATTALGAATVAAAKADRVQSLFGATDSSNNSGTSIADTTTELQSAVIALVGTIESDTLSGLVVESLDALAAQLRDTSTSVQDLRAAADAEIADAVDVANDALDTIASLNKQIVAAKAMGQSTADLEDKRNTALTTLAGQLDISYLVKSNGEMLVSTKSGTSLVGSTVNHLQYTPAAVVNADSVFAGITVGGKDVTSEITSGTIGGLLEQRDKVLPAVTESLDALAVKLIDVLNSAYNAGTSLPPPTTLSGSTAVTASDTLAASGTVRLAVTDSDGTLVSYADLNLDQLDTVGDLVDALNGISGISASIASGKLVITSTSSAGIAIADIDSALGSPDQGFSDYFGLNDLLAGSSAATIRVRSDLLTGAAAFATATLTTDADPAIGARVVSASSSFVQSLETALSADHAFEAAGGIPGTSASFASYAGSVVAKVATTASQATSQLETRQSNYDTASDALTSLTGVNVDEETARLSELEQQYSTAAHLLEVLNAMFDALLAAVRS